MILKIFIFCFFALAITNLVINSFIYIYLQFVESFFLSNIFCFICSESEFVLIYYFIWQLSREVDDLKTQHSHKEAMMKIDTHRLEQELKILKEHLAQNQEEEVRKSTMVERIFIDAREAIEKDRLRNRLLLVEQNKLQHKVEKMTESLKSYQVCLMIRYYRAGYSLFN